VNKIYISADDLLRDSYKLAETIVNSDFRPDFLIGIWRGGAPVGVAVQEYLDYVGLKTDHIAIRTSSYYGIDKQHQEVEVFGLNYVVDNVSTHTNLLIIDDVFDSGRSVQAVIEEIHAKAGTKTPLTIKIASPWFKPKRNVTKLKPDFYLHETDDWLVFPHELCGLTIEEISRNKYPALAESLQISKGKTDSSDK